MNRDRWKTVEEVFQDALERTPDERASFIGAACAGDGALRREVEALLARANVQTEGFGRPVLAAMKELFQDRGERLLGRRLGPYQLEAWLGAGGMGEVYRALDLRLERNVAIKILPSADPDFKARFEREAKAIAALQHPNICTLHDVGNHDGTDYLVLEYLEGETLADRLKRGPLPLEQALSFAIEVAGALDKAHRVGLVHRDLKPSNVMLTKDGAKLLDFGLAKSVPTPFGPVEPSMLATAAPNLTAQGTILGTLQYMAPEQLEGQEADARTDIFGFGVVLYEMLTGKKAFEGKTQASLIAAIIEREPNSVSTTLSSVSPVLDRVVRKCLAKNPGARWQSAYDLQDELRWVADSVQGASAISASRPPWRERAWWFSTTVAGAAVVTLGVVIFGRAVSESPVTQLEINTPPTADPASFALSPDGRQLAFVATADGVPKLWLRPLDQPVGQPLAATDGASAPFWAPDGRALGFFAGGKLKRLDLGGGAPLVLADAPFGRGGTWSRDGIIIFAPSTTGPLLRLPASSGSATATTELEQTRHQSHRWPQILPDGRHFLFLATNGPEPSAEYLGSLDGAAPKRLLATNTGAAYAAPGYLLVVDQSVLMARRLDLARGEVGDPIPVAQPVASDENLFRGAFAASATGVLVHRSTAAERRQLVWMDRTGKQLSTVTAHDENDLLNPELAPEGRRAAVQRTVKGNADTWVLDGAVPRRLTFHPANDNAPVWSPDGRRLVFRSNRGGTFDLYEKAASGGGTEQLFLASAQIKLPLSWSPDGRFFLYQVLDREAGFNLWALSLTGDRKPFSILNTRFNERNGQFAPDGRWIAYDSNELGRVEIFVQPFPGPGGKFQISTDGGVAPRWRHDGRELYYIRPDGVLMAVPVRASTDGQALEPGVPEPLFHVPVVFGGSAAPGGAARAQYAVAPDGQRFLINVTVEVASAPPINIVLNWNARLRY